MGDLNSSDCSWKKMVIAKANNEWISTIKSEHGDASHTFQSQNNLGLEHIDFHNIKKEREEPVEDSHQIEESVSMPQEIDPLSQEDCLLKRRRRRKGSALISESPHERALRLAKMSAYAAHRLANETQEQRALRLKRMSEYAAKRLAQETSEQRAKRLARMSAYAAKRLANETPEQRQARLTRMSAYAARRHAMKKVPAPGTLADHPTLMFNF